MTRAGSFPVGTILGTVRGLRSIPVLRPQCPLGAVTPLRTAGLNRLEQPVFPKYLVSGNHVYPIGTVRFG